MNVLDLLRHRGSAPVARERLHILLSYERAGREKRDLLVILHEEITAAIAKHVAVDRDNVQVRMDRSDTASTLGIEVEIPHSVVCAGGLPFPDDPS
jgi:cell division topological specificity factor